MGEGWKWGWRLERDGRGVKIRRGELDKGRDVFCNHMYLPAR